MKRLISLALIVLFALSLSAQVFSSKNNKNVVSTQQTIKQTKSQAKGPKAIIFQDNLEAGNLNNFTVINGGDPNGFEWNSFGGNLGPGCARIHWSATAHDDYLILPQITNVQTQTILSFWYKHQSDSYPEIFDVVLSTTGNAAPDFTVILAQNVSATTAYQEFTYDLSDYVGQDIYVGIHTTTTDQYFLYLDDFKVEKIEGANITFNVTDGANPIEGATVTVGATDYTTNSSGQVTDFFAPGDINYSVSKFGYITVPGTYTVVDGVNDTIDVTLSLVPTYDVTFTVKNVNQDLLQNAFVEVYDATHTLVASGNTNVNGVYVAQLIDGNYTFDVSYVGYQPLSDSSFTVNGGALDIEVQLQEIFLPVQNLTYNLVGTDVTLNWNTPTFFISTLQWDDGTNYTSIGTGLSANFAVAHRYDPSDLASIKVVRILSVSFVPNEINATYTIKIWQGADLNSLSEIYSQEVTSFNTGQWNEVILTTPPSIDKNQILLVGYDINTTTGYPAGCDASLENPGKGNLIYWEDAWQQLTDLAPALTFEWNIKFEFEADGYFDGQYNVYLDDVLDNISPLNQTTYTINNLTAGTHTVGVTALFDTDESDTVEVQFTVIINHTVTFNVVGGNGTLAATVDGNPINSGDQVSEGSDVVFTATPDSLYQVKVWTLNDNPVTGNTSNTYTLNNLTADATVTVEFEIPTGLNNTEANITISPNPTKGILNIVADGSYNINILDVTGKIVASQTMNNNNQTIDLSNLANGVYYIRLSNQTATKVVKIVKE